jgi:hypothetical protein
MLGLQTRAGGIAQVAELALDKHWGPEFNPQHFSS